MCAQQMLCLDDSNPQEVRNITKLYMIARGHLFHVYGPPICSGIFYKREIFQLKYHWVERKYLDTIQNRRWQFFCQHDIAFFNCFF